MSEKHKKVCNVLNYFPEGIGDDLQGTFRGPKEK